MSSSPFIITPHVVATSYIREYPGSTLTDQEAKLKLHVKQYKPKQRPSTQPKPVTIVAVHANGFPKELYEPLWEELYVELCNRGQGIRGIWVVDAAFQGQSGVLNEDQLGNDPGWNDTARDMLLLINQFRKEMPRPIVGIGHSMGGNNLVNLALMHPRLLSALALIEPVMAARGTQQTPASYNPNSPDPRLVAVRASTFRRDIWSSRREAEESFQRSKFYSTWDRRVLERWLEYGLRDLPTTTYPETSDLNNDASSDERPVTLATTKHQEVFTFLRPNFGGKFSPDGKGLVVDREQTPDIDPDADTSWPFYRPEVNMAFQQLPHLRPPVLYLFGGSSTLSIPSSRKARVERTGVGIGGSGGAKDGRVQECVLLGAGHLVAFEKVKPVARRIGGFISEELLGWNEKEEKWTQEWREKSRQERTMISKEWEGFIGGRPRDLMSNPAKF